MDYDESRALQLLDNLFKRNRGAGSNLYSEFNNWKLQLLKLNAKANSAAGLSPHEEYELRRVYAGLNKVALAVGSISFTELATQPAEFIQQQEVRILFLAANPVGFDELRLSEEARTIEDRLQGSDQAHYFKFIPKWAVRLDDVTESVLRHQPFILHFSGHGSETGAIMLEDDSGIMRPISPKKLARFFQVLDKKISYVVLNACFSAEQARAIAKEVDAVVGMTRAISDKAAIKFARGFYRALGFGKDVKMAFELGCYEIDAHELNEQTSPQLLLKKDGRIKSYRYKWV